MASNISSRGTIENFLHQGITPQDAVMELVDNEIDAGAQTVVLRINKGTRTLTVSGDGQGMDRERMITGLRINNTRPASEAIGLRGVGGKAGLAVLSGLEFSALILSRMEGQRTYEVEIDWPGTMREDQWAPTPSGLTRDNGEVWDANRINPEHGTVVQVEMPQAVLDRLLSNLEAELARVYELRIVKGLTLRVVIDGTESSPLSTSRALGYATAKDPQETKIQLLRNPETGKMRGYIERDFHKKKVWARRDGKKVHKDYPQALEAGFECIGEFTLLSAYDPSWTEGYMSPCRNGRFLGVIRTQVPGSGDHGKRKITANSRHGLLFSQENDAQIGVQVNKSAVSRDDMNSALLEAVDWAMADFSTKLWNAVKPPTVRAPAEEKELKRRWKMLQEACWAREALLEEFEARLLEVADESSDDEADA